MSSNSVSKMRRARTSAEIRAASLAVERVLMLQGVGGIVNGLAERRRDSAAATPGMVRKRNGIRAGDASELNP